ncbi:mRNA-decapping enzyme-like protein [Triticum dicoccoides]|uniref:mRNA-decapping enzyme-like protein n=1 Tax=Triticum dicoccoides TaxID=85692 RepID=UPI0003D505DF|nr:mRNA-decapping enzyme-like protein [Triticum dicoccoides]
MARRGGGGGGRRSKVTPNLGADREGTRMLNLTVLRRLDPATVDILITAASVTAYSFDQDTVRWSHKGVEGSLFVVKRNTQPRFQFLIMNRRNTENLVEDLLGGFDYKVEVPYIIYTNAAAEIIGIWFYEPEECEEVAHLFSRIRKAYSRASPEKLVPSVKSFSDCEELEVASDVPSSEDTLEQPTTPSTLVPGDVEFKLLSALLTAAACVGAPTGGAGPVQPNQPIRAVPSSRRASPAPSAVSSQPPASHNLLPAPRASAATVVPQDAHVPTSAPTIQPASLSKPPFFPPIVTTSSQAATAHAAFPSSAPPPFLPPLSIQHRQSAPYFQPFPLPSAPPPIDPPHRQSAPLSQPFAQSTAPPPPDPQRRESAPLAQPFTQSTAPPALDPQQRQSAVLLKPFQLSSAPPPPRPQHWQRSPSLEHFARPTECLPPPYGALLLQPFPPPNPPPPLLAPTASYGPVILSRDNLRGALLRLVQNDDFINMFYREIVKG